LAALSARFETPGWPAYARGAAVALGWGFLVSAVRRRRETWGWPLLLVGGLGFPVFWALVDSWNNFAELAKPALWLAACPWAVAADAAGLAVSRALVPLWFAGTLLYALAGLALLRRT